LIEFRIGETRKKAGFHSDDGVHIDQPF